MAFSDVIDVQYCADACLIISLISKGEQVKMRKDCLGNKYSEQLYAKTKFYQKQYGFSLKSLDGDTHNNEADAFKHAFGAADIALKTTSGRLKLL